MEIISIVAVCTIAALDRFYLKRRCVDINSIYQAQSDDLTHRFVIGFSINEKLLSSSITYTLRDKNNPKTVVSGKPRTLEFSPTGANEEYLLFPRHLIKSGKWILDVKVTSFGSRINPFYKLFPITKTESREFQID